MKAIIIAAGRGSRLGQLTEVLPKCMITVNKLPILHRAVAALRIAGIEDVVVIRGFAASELICLGCRYIEHRDWAQTNVLGSLFAAKDEISGDVLICYSDILFTPEVVRKAIEGKGNIVPVIDRDWLAAYVGRLDHPPAEAEKVELNSRTIKAIGKRNIPICRAEAEFIGMLKLDAIGAHKLCDAYSAAKALFAGRPFVTAPTFETAYLADLLQYMIDLGEFIQPAFTEGGWREIDTAEDLSRAGEWLNAQQ